MCDNNSTSDESSRLFDFPVFTSKYILKRSNMRATPTVAVCMLLSTCRGFSPVGVARSANLVSRRVGQVLRASTRAQPSRGEGFWTSRDKCWRPDVSDVERISYGKPAKKKGTGSRGVPHRLNNDERLLFDQARRKGFAEIGGSGWRSQRRDAPFMNTYRSLCDARGQASIVLHKGSTGEDELVVDLSPLRLPEAFSDVALACLEYAGLPGAVEGGIAEMDGDAEGSSEPDEDPFETRPIYQLPPYCVVWQLPRSEAKALGKRLAVAFDTVEAKATKSKKPNHVKAGKGRRHGGYGIG